MILWVEVRDQDIEKILQQQVKLSSTVTTASCRDTKAKINLQLLESQFYDFKENNIKIILIIIIVIIVRPIGGVRHICSVQLYTSRLWLFILFLKPQYWYVSKFLEEADRQHAGDSFWLFYGL